MPTTTVAIVPPKIIVLRQWSDGNSFSSIRYILPQTTEWVGYTPTILINNKRSMSASARRVYILTFVTYALVHGTRTCWSYIKTYSQNEPLNFSTQFLGELDMTVLICLSISLKTLGWIGQKIGYKNFLIIGMSYVVFTFMLIGILQIVGVAKHWVYVLLYAMLGIAGCTAWPSCLSIVSQYYPPKENGFELCIWNGCSQFGDFVALGLGYLLIEVGRAKPQSLILTMCGIIMFMIAIDWFFLDIKKTPQEQPIEQNKNTIQKKLEKPKFVEMQEAKCKELSQPKAEDRDIKIEEEKCNTSTSQSHIRKASDDKMENLTQPTTAERRRANKKVNFLNVWLLPSVASYVLCFACLKSVNAIIMNWLLFYLFSIGLHKYSGTITVSWSICVFTGSLLMGYYNISVNKIGLIVPLLLTSFVFSYIGVQYERNNGYHYLFMMIVAGLCFGGPFGLIGSKITLLLGKNPKIRDRQGAVGAIISVMQGFGLFIGAFFVLIVPYIHLRNMFFLPSILCIIASAILYFEHIKQQDQLIKQRQMRRQEQLREQRRQETMKALYIV